MRARLGATTIMALLLASCGGGGGGGTTPAAPTIVTGPTATPAPAGGTGTLSFSIAIPATTTASSGRAPKYVSPSTASITIGLQGSATPLATANLSAGAPGCSAVATGGTTCTVSVNAPAGNDTFVIATYDGTNGGGHQLSVAQVVASISTSSTTRIPLALSGVAASAAVILGSSSVPVGTPASVSVSIVAYDAQNNVIIGPGAFSSPITLTDTDSSAQTSLSTTSVSGPGTSVTLNYAGGSMNAATITTSLGGTATFAPTGYAVGSHLLPGTDLNVIRSVTSGPDGNIWYGTDNTGGPPVIGKMTPAGSVTEYVNPTGVTNDEIVAMTVGSDGNIWFASTPSLQIGKITPSGTVTLAPTYNTGCGSNLCNSVNAMVAGPDGNIWFTDFAGYIGVATTAGVVTEKLMSTINGWPAGLSSSPNQLAFVGNTLYVADGGAFNPPQPGALEQISIANGAPTQVTYLASPAGTACNTIYGLVIGPDGNIWFSDDCANIGLVPPTNFTAGGILMWSVAGVDQGATLASLVSSPGGVWGATDTINSIFRIFTPTGLSASTGPPVAPVTVFSSTNISAYLLALGPDGNVWTGGDTVPPQLLGKVIYGGGATSTLGLHRASSTISRVPALNGRHTQQQRLRR